MTFFSRMYMAVLLAAPAVILPGCGGGSGNNGSNSPATVTTLAGAAESGAADGTPAVARFNNPVNVAIDALNNVYVCDFDNNRIRKISPAGNVTTLVNQANFQRPFGIAITPNGTLYVQTDANDSGARDETTGTIWRVNPAGGATLVARNLGRPRGLAALDNNRLVLVDVAQNDVRLLTLSSGAITPIAGLRGTAGFASGSGTTARFNRPYGPAITASGNILLADQNNHALRLVTLAGQVTTFAGNGTPGFANGSLANARFNAPQDVDIDSRGYIYVSDNENHRIRRITPGGNVETLAGDGVKGYQEGNGTTARFYGQEGLAISDANTRLVVADGNGGDGSNFNRVRILTVP